MTNPIVSTKVRRGRAPKDPAWMEIVARFPGFNQLTYEDRSHLFNVCDQDMQDRPKGVVKWPSGKAKLTHGCRMYVGGEVRSFGSGHAWEMGLLHDIVALYFREYRRPLVGIPVSLDVSSAELQKVVPGLNYEPFYAAREINDNAALKTWLEDLEGFLVDRGLLHLYTEPLAPEDKKKLWSEQARKKTEKHKVSTALEEHQRLSKSIKSTVDAFREATSARLDNIEAVLARIEHHLFADKQPGDNQRPVIVSGLNPPVITSPPVPFVAPDTEPVVEPPPAILS